MKAVTVLSAHTAKTMWKHKNALKVLCIEGFSNENGNTKALLDEFLREYKNAEIIKYNTYKESPKPCYGCGFCKENEKCVYSDLQNFFILFETADIIIVASPIYNLSFPAPLKALIDRLQPYYESYYKYGKIQKIKKRREAYFLAAAGRDGEKAFNIMRRQLKNAFSITNIEYKGDKLHANTDNIKESTKGENDG